MSTFRSYDGRSNGGNHTEASKTKGYQIRSSNVYLDDYLRETGRTILKGVGKT